MTIDYIKIKIINSLITLFLTSSYSPFFKFGVLSQNKTSMSTLVVIGGGNMPWKPYALGVCPGWKHQFCTGYCWQRKYRWVGAISSLRVITSSHPLKQQLAHRVIPYFPPPFASSFLFLTPISFGDFTWWLRCEMVNRDSRFKFIIQ